MVGSGARRRRDDPLPVAGYIRAAEGSAMAIVVLVLWLFTAGAGFYLLLTSSPGRAPPARPPNPTPPLAPVGPPAAPAPTATAPAPVITSTPTPASASAASATTAGTAARTADGAPRRAARRAARSRWDPPSLVAARQAPVLPGARSLVEFAHPTGGIIGLAFWLGFTLVPYPPPGRVGVLP